jgi:hypothetical protein
MSAEYVMPISQIIVAAFEIRIFSDSEYFSGAACSLDRAEI